MTELRLKLPLLLSLLLATIFGVVGQRIVTLENGGVYKVEDELHVISKIEPMRKSHIDHVGIVFDFDWKVFASKMDEAIDDIDRLDAVLREIKINVRTDYPNGALYQICKRIKI